MADRLAIEYDGEDLDLFEGGSLKAKVLKKVCESEENLKTYPRRDTRERLHQEAKVLTNELIRCAVSRLGTGWTNPLRLVTHSGDG